MKVLLAIDDSGESEAATRAIVEQFRPGDTEVCVLHALTLGPTFPLSLSFARGNSYGTQLQVVMKQAREHAEALVNSICNALRDRGFRASAAVIEGEPLDAILDRAAAWGAELIVLASHDREGTDRTMFRGMAEEVAHRAPCSVEIVRVH